MSKKVLLAILDGWGIGDKSNADVIFNANTPFWDSIIANYPNNFLLASGENVGLPDGQMGNSEVGHLNIGAGRVVYQDLVKINLAIRDNSIASNLALIDAFNYAVANDKSIHFLGLVSDGGVHSSIDHLYKLIDITKDFNAPRVFIHALTDGRDTDPKSGINFIKNLDDYINNTNNNAIIASICGRYYTMDRDKRWERVKIGYDLLVNSIGKHVRNVVAAVEDSYNEGVTDEFIKPIVYVDENNIAVGKINEGDVVVCFNFRTDRLREITIALTQRDLDDYGMKTIDLNYLTMTPYDDSFVGVKVIFDKDNVENTIGEVISNAGLKQLRIAETEKYAHVTFFFSGGRENEFDGENRILIKSPNVATYDLQPEMSAYIVKDALVNAINNDNYDFICLNFANGDMVGHTGVYNSILKAVESVDECLYDVVEAAKNNNYTVIIIADHGNADYAMNDDGTPNTAHSLNPVPIVLISEEYSNISSGVLADVAPTILKIMGIDIPKEMTGKALI